MLLKNIIVISNERLLNITFKIIHNNYNLHTKKNFFLSYTYNISY